TIWDEYNIINNGLGKHKGASCKYCPTSWARERAQDMQSHLAMKCKENVPREIRIKVLRDLQSEDDPMPSGSKPTTLKKRKSNPLLSLDAYYDTVEAIDKSKEARANKLLIKWIVSSASSILNAEAANIILKIEKELFKAKNLTLCIDSWCSPLKHSIYAFVIVTNERKQYVYALRDFSKFSHTTKFNTEKIIEVLKNVGPEKFVAITTNAESAMMMAK
ncbi:6119_t:CDS:2, partial [Cetraspora pellucida]